MVKLNRRVTIKRWSATQNEIGGNNAILISEWVKWAQVDDRSGSNTPILTSRGGGNSFYNQQQVWTYDYKVILRYEKSRPTHSNDTVDYEGQRMKVESIDLINEGFKQFEVLRCSKVDGDITSNVI